MFLTWSSTGGDRVVDGLDLEHVEFDGSPTAKNAHHDLEPPLLGDDLLDGSDEILERPVVDLHLIALSVGNLLDILGLAALRMPEDVIDFSDVQTIRAKLIRRHCGIWPPHTDLLARMDRLVALGDLDRDGFEALAEAALSMPSMMPRTASAIAANALGLYVGLLAGGIQGHVSSIVGPDATNGHRTRREGSVKLSDDRV